MTVATVKVSDFSFTLSLGNPRITLCVFIQ